MTIQQSRRLRHRLLSSWPVRRAIDITARAFCSQSDSLLVAMFHRVQCADTFALQVDTILEGRDPVSGSQILDHVRKGTALPRSAVWITFDDGYGDFIEHAWPVLRSRALRPTQFVPTAFVGQAKSSFWWDRIEAAISSAQADSLQLDETGAGTSELTLRGSGRHKTLKRIRNEVKRRPHQEGMELVEIIIDACNPSAAEPEVRTLTWNEIRELESEGVEFGGHTYDHPMLDQVDEDECLRQIRRGFEVLHSELHNPLPILAFPSGQFNDVALRCARLAGAEACVSTQQALARSRIQDAFQIPRVGFGPHANSAAVRLRVLLASL